MTKPRQIAEHRATLRESGGRWLINVITPGVGSSATYREEILARDAATAFPRGTKLWFKHPQEGEHAGSRDPRDQWGVLDEDAAWSPEAGAVQAPARVFKHWAPVVDSIGEDAELSVFVWAEVDDNGEAAALLPHRTNSVDMVSYAGRPGSGLDRKIEAAREAANEPGVTSASQEKENDMEKAEVEAILDAKLTPIVAFVNESTANKAAEAQAKVDAEAIATATKGAIEKFRESMKRIDDAELLEPIAESLTERAAAGEDITEAIITKAKEQSDKLFEAAKTRLGESHDGEDDGFVGRVFEGAEKPATAQALTEGLGW